jgi:hypothetical protein
MKGVRRGLAVVPAGIIVILASLALSAPAQAADTIRSATSCCTFTGGPFAQALGENPVYENSAGSDAPHNVTALDAGPDGGPLFASETITPGTSSVVDGTQYLSAGTYPFYCTLHGASMSGDLIVDGSRGTLAPRPRITVAIPAQKLRVVRRTGKLKVTVASTSGGGGIKVRVTRGTKLMGFGATPPIPVGSKRTISISLTKSARAAIRSGRVVKLAAEATVRFGQPASAVRNLR